MRFLPLVLLAGCAAPPPAPRGDVTWEWYRLDSAAVARAAGLLLGAHNEAAEWKGQGLILAPAQALDLARAGGSGAGTVELPASGDHEVWLKGRVVSGTIDGAGFDVAARPTPEGALLLEITPWLRTAGKVVRIDELRAGVRVAQPTVFAIVPSADDGHTLGRAIFGRDEGPHFVIVRVD